MKIVLFTFIHLMVATLAFSQLKIEKQVEISLASPQQSVVTINLGKSGVLLCMEKGSTLLSMTLCDTALQAIWQQEYPVSFKLVTQIHALQGGFIHFFANRQDSVYQVISINLANGVASLIDCISSLDVYNEQFKITHFTALKNAFLFGGENAQGQPAILYYDMMQKEFKILPNINFLKAKIIEIKNSESSGFFSVLLASKGNFYYHLYDNEGKLLTNHEVRPESKDKKYKNYYFNTCQTYLKNNKEQYVIGIYATSSLKPNPQGVYVAHFNNYRHQETNFYSFNQFQNFHNHLDSVKKNKVLTKIATKGNYYYDYDVVVQGLQETDRQLLLALKVSKRNYTNHYTQNTATRKHPILRSGRFEKMQDIYITPPTVTSPESLANRRVKTEATNPIPYEPSAFVHKKDTIASQVIAMKQQYGSYSYYLYYNTVSCILDNSGKILWDNIFDESSFNLSFEIGNYWEGNSAVGLKNGQISAVQLVKDFLFFHKSKQGQANQEIYQMNSPFSKDLQLPEQVFNWYEDKFLYVGSVNEQDTNKPFFSFKVKLLKIVSAN